MVSSVLSPVLSLLFVQTVTDSVHKQPQSRGNENLYNKTRKMVLSLEDPAVRSYILYSSILGLKVLGMATITSIIRKSRGVFASPEDVKMFKGKVKFDDTEVERVRRAHLNDLENIPAFWILGALYLTTNPAASWATLLFRTYTAGRIIHSVVYAIVPMPQPTRAIAYAVPFAITVYMGVQTMLHYVTAM